MARVDAVEDVDLEVGGKAEGRVDDQGAPAPPISALRTIFRRFWPYLRKDRKKIVLAVAFMVATVFFEVASILLFGYITDEALATGNLSGFWQPALVWVGLAAVGGLTSFVGGFLTAIVAENFLLRLRTAVFDHVQTLSPNFFRKRRLGDLVARMSGDAEMVERLVATGVVDGITALVSLVFFAGSALYLRWDLALVVFAIVPAFWLAARIFSRKLKLASRAERLSNGDISTAVQESLASITLVQTNNLQEVERERVRRHGVAWRRAKLREAKLVAGYTPIAHFVELVCVLAVIGVGVWEIANGRITLGGLLAFTAFLGYLYPVIQDLGELVLTANEAAAGSERLIELLDAKPDVVDLPGAIAPPARARGQVAFDRVSYSYPGTICPAVAWLSFTASPGEFVVISGASGAGKSTVAALLLRLFDPTFGRVLLDGVDVRALTLLALRDNVTLVQQETTALRGTIADNIAFGSPNADLAEIVAAARTAGAHEFIMRMPQRYETEIGERGHRLSGGERQRIALARAVYRDTPVLVLDEPTTGLDKATARQVTASIRELAVGRTTIMITHDLQLAPDADRIIVLAGGRIVEQGDHEQLLAFDGHYRRLYLQSTAATAATAAARS